MFFSQYLCVCMFKQEGLPRVTARGIPPSAQHHSLSCLWWGVPLVQGDTSVLSGEYPCPVWWQGVPLVLSRGASLSCLGVPPSAGPGTGLWTGPMTGLGGTPQKGPGTRSWDTPLWTDRQAENITFPRTL